MTTHGARPRVFYLPIKASIPPRQTVPGLIIRLQQGALPQLGDTEPLLAHRFFFQRLQCPRIGQGEGMVAKQHSRLHQ
ncbi:TPA: hypothetical protein F3L05_03420 [Aeromonas hydrophila]|nr:hypothetical protein [Aeromonas hydrophila]